MSSIRKYPKKYKLFQELYNGKQSYDNKIQEDARICGFSEYRGDRIGKNQGGIIIYTQEYSECKVLRRLVLSCP